MLLVLLSTIFFSTFASAQECGTAGKLEQRISDCKLQKNSSFTLVSRDRKGREVHLMDVLHTDVQANRQVRYRLLWSALLANEMNTRQAMSACHGQIPEVMGLSQYDWRLPTMNELFAAFWAGVENSRASVTRDILNFDNKLIFTSEFNEYSMPWMFDDIMVTGYRHFVPVAPSERNFVICVAPLRVK